MRSRETPAPQARRDELPMQFMQGAISFRALDDGDNADDKPFTVDVTFSAGATVRRSRYDWQRDTVVTFDETLVVSPEAVNLERLNAGGAVLDSHRTWDGVQSLVGVVDRAWVDGGLAAATLRFPQRGTSPNADRIADLVRQKIIVNVSAGYSIDKVRRIPATETEVEKWIVERWTPHEISFVFAGADPAAQVRGADTAPDGVQSFPFEIVNRAQPADEEVTMTIRETQPAGQSASEDTKVDTVQTRAGNDKDPVTGTQPPTLEQRTAAFTRIRSAFGVSAEDQLTAMARSGLTADAWRDELIDARAAADEQSHTSGIRMVRDGRETMIAGMTEALVARLGRTQPTDQARSFMEHGFADMAAEAIGFRGRLTPARRDEVLTRAFHTTSDFPNIMGTAVGRVLLSRYQSAPASYREIFAKRDLVDFRATNLIRVGDFPNLLQIGEAGEVKAGTVSESKETITLATYGRQLRFSRSMLINDDLGAMAQIIASIGDRVAAFENSMAWTLVQSASGAGPTLATDSLAVFHSTHGNLAGSGAVPGVSTIAAGRAAMRKQKSLEKTADGTSGIPLNITPKYIVSGPDHETTIEQLTTSIQAQDAAKVNPFSSKLTPIGEANITGNSWYLFADPGAAPVFTYGHLEGAPGPQVRQDEPFGVLGLALQVVLDFAVAAVDYRGGYRNPGAAPA